MVRDVEEIDAKNRDYVLIFTVVPLIFFLSLKICWELIGNYGSVHPLTQFILGALIFIMTYHLMKIFEKLVTITFFQIGQK